MRILGQFGKWAVALRCHLFSCVDLPEVNPKGSAHCKPPCPPPHQDTLVLVGLPLPHVSLEYPHKGTWSISTPICLHGMVLGQDAPQAHLRCVGLLVWTLG